MKTNPPDEGDPTGKSKGTNPADKKRARCESPSTMGMIYGIGVGVAFGAALGAALDNVGLGVALGICFGSAVGMILGKKSPS